MKGKGISFWEQNIERIVLGTAGVFFVGFTVWQVVLREPNAVSGTKPGDVDTDLLAAAEELSASLQPGAPSPVQVPDYEPVLDQFERLVASSVTPAPTIVASHPRMSIGGEETYVAGVPYVEPKIGAPHTVRTEQFFDAIQPEVVSEWEDLQAQFEEAPYDVDWITASAVFDLAQVRAAYGAASDDHHAIPGEWYGDRIDILDVRVEREELVDGSWANRTVLPPLTGQWSFRPQLEGTVDQSTKQAIMAELRGPGGQESIVHPAFYDLVNNSWATPDPRLAEEEAIREDMDEETRKLIRQQKQLNQWIRQRESAFETLTSEGGRLDPPQPPAGSGGPGGTSGSGSAGGGGAPPGGAGFGGGLGGGGSRGRRGAQRAQQALEERHKKLRAQILALDAKIERLATELGEEERVAAATSQPVVPLMERDEIVVWAHDMDLEPGRSYRYRFSIDLYNPFFARKLDLLEEQQDLAEGLTIRSQTSDWSSDIRAIPPLRVFMTKANGPSQGEGSLRLGQATAQVFRFEYGRWWQESFSVEPGDRVGGMKATPAPRRDPDAPADAAPPVRVGPAEIDYGTDWFVLDVLDRVDASDEDRERGLAARVVLQSATDPGLLKTQDPLTDRYDEEFEFLRAAVEQAETKSELGG